MSHFRFLSYLAPRISQFLGWSVDTNSLADPLLKREEIPQIQKQILLKTHKLQSRLYQPPHYVAPKFPNV
jgi:hypothetical protein